ncbi:vWA domain-containing protein [Marinibacterium sp. SX1]|uniref:vWA domain-containing protein n=1 Tax=Marinibacterium sp. SX1 TaxID=3388424 RepID=UPI003D176790
MAFDRPLLLVFAALALIPLMIRPQRPAPLPRLPGLAPDGLSRGVSLALPSLGALAVLALVTALAGPYRGGGLVLRDGIGAHIVLLFDRSSSMNDSFAGRRPDGGEESKSAVARRLILDFIDKRPHDRIGVAAFSTSPMVVMPLTDHLDAVQGAVSAIDQPGLAHTDVGSGLALALGLFPDDTPPDSRALILVSDGAGVIERRVQDLLRARMAENPVNLYWLFIRTRGSPGIFDVPDRSSEDTPHARPERHLHLFLQDLGVPYHALEAESPEAIAEAIARIDRLESHPVTYRARVARRDLGPLFYRIAALCLAVLALAAGMERDLCRDGRARLPVLRRGAE